MIQFLVRVWSAMILAGLLSGQAPLANLAVFAENVTALLLAIMLEIALVSGIDQAKPEVLQKMSTRLQAIRGQVMLQFTLKLAIMAVLAARGHFVVAMLSLSNVLLAYAFYVKLQYRLKNI